jgi:hypothetical protein
MTSGKRPSSSSASSTPKGARKAITFHVELIVSGGLFLERNSALLPKLLDLLNTHIQWEQYVILKTK